MKRRKPLRADPEKQRAWERRSREKQIELARGFLTADPEHGGFRATNPPVRFHEPALRGFTQRVFTLYGRKCVVCRRRAAQAHHVIPKRTLKARQEPAETLGDARNGVPVCVRCHERHEGATRRICRDELPLGVIAWAYANNFGWYIDDVRYYPPAAAAA